MKKVQKKISLPLLNNLINKKNWEIDQVFVISLDGRNYRIGR